MLTKCDAVVLRRKKFSDFELIDPSLLDDTDQIYMTGYLETAEGEKKNIRLPSSLFFKDKYSSVITTLDSTQVYEDVKIKKKVYGESKINVAEIEYNVSNDFLQINHTAQNMFMDFDGKKYLCLRLSENTPIGHVHRFYFPNFPLNHGVIIFPKSEIEVSEDEPIEVFFNEQIEGDSQEANDFYFTVIHIADPKSIGAEEVVLKTKVIGVLNIESDKE